MSAFKVPGRAVMTRTRPAGTRARAGGGGRGAAQRARPAGPRAGDRGVGLQGAGPRGHDQDAVAEDERLVDRVGDEDDGLPAPFPDLEELFLEEALVLLVERRERLI